ncbi:MAG: hypothetical protein WBA51_08815 [Erythrobacter sp.]
MVLNLGRAGVVVCLLLTASPAMQVVISGSASNLPVGHSFAAVLTIAALHVAPFVVLLLSDRVNLLLPFQGKVFPC